MQPNHKLTLSLIAFAVVALYLLGNGITGFVISESCCFPPDCEPEYMCDAAEPEFSYPKMIDENFAFIYFGGALGLLTLIIHLYHKKGFHKE